MLKDKWKDGQIDGNMNEGQNLITLGTNYQLCIAASIFLH